MGAEQSPGSVPHGTFQVLLESSFTCSLQICSSWHESTCQYCSMLCIEWRF